MDGCEFAKYIKDQAKLRDIKDYELECAVGSILTTSVKERIAASNDPLKATKEVLTLLATIMKCFNITPEMLADPLVTKILNKIGDMLENASPPEDENLQ